VGVSKEKEKRRRGSSTTTESIGESEEALWDERTVSKRSSDEYGGVDDTVGSSNSCRIQGM